ncbi:low temperature-induced protein [Paenibacillus pectinilyticus]|uniref:Low temperature-induced protein n=1 Tax=Paenibacillus pectinilyticus TaxID=512399 RepID=A0A1C1A3A5_9BACL|nr:general stress protein [Paenibacillus pectinilyticus]OCT15034.1 low temperature-induced protein [Paenibacillus pectinilyticus]
MSKHIIGIFNTEEEAIRVINQLKAEGFHSEELSVIGRNREDLDHIEVATATKAEEGLATGAATGGVLGGVTGLLVSIGALAIPGLGPIIAAGPIVAILTGAAVGASAGGLVGGLVGLGIPEKEAMYYDEYVQNGKVLVLVDSGVDRANLAYRIFRDHKSLNADTYSPDYGYINSTYGANDRYRNNF